MTSISTSRHPDEGGAHIDVSVFAGPDRDHRARVGVLTFRRGEDNEFIRRVEDRYQPPEWLLVLHDWLTTVGAAPLDFDGDPIPPRLRMILDRYFQGAAWEEVDPA